MSIRSIGSLGVLALTAAAFAQGSFTIVRPADNSRVREKIKILMPKGSIPSGGYIGVYLNDKFIEATRPTEAGNFFQYILDTKGRGIPDTEPGKKDKLEVVLFVDYGDQARIVDRSSVDLTIANRANIPVPNSGLKLRYNWALGKQATYSVLIRAAVDQITEEQSKAGGKAAELPLGFEKFRVLYAVDNVVDGNGIVRLQALPPRGKTVLFYSPEGEPRAYDQSELAPIYMNLTPTGVQVNGSIPEFFPFDGFSGQGSDIEYSLFASFPLPVLPTKAVRPGDVWASRFQNGNIDLNKGIESTSVVRTFPARGEFIRTEWERGRPCAVLRNSIETASASIESAKLARQGADVTAENKLKVSETIWFALDTRQVIKVIRDQISESKITSAAGAGGFGGPPSGAGGRGPGGRPSAGAGGGKMSGSAKDDRMTPPGSLRQGRPGAGGRGGRQGGGRFGGPPAGFGRPGGAGFPGSGGANGEPPKQTTVLQRRTTQIILTLE